jgi:hypothetical protein
MRKRNIIIFHTDQNLRTFLPETNGSGVVIFVTILSKIISFFIIKYLKSPLAASLSKINLKLENSVLRIDVKMKEFSTINSTHSLKKRERDKIQIFSISTPYPFRNNFD